MSVTSYEVGAVFRLMDEASPVLRQISERLTSLEKLIGRVSGAMKSIGDTKVGALGGGLQGIDDKLRVIGEKALGIGSKITQGMQGADDAIVGTGRLIQGVDTALGGLGKAAQVGSDGIIANFGRADAALDTTVRTARSLSTELRGAAAASREIGRLPGMSGGGGGGHIRPGSPSNGGSHGGNAYGRHGVGVDAGIFGFVGFESIKGGIEATLHRGMELAHVQEQMRQAGFADADIGRATGAAWKESRTYGLDVSKTLGDIKELALPFGSVDHAINFIEPLEKMRVVLNSVQEGRGNSSAEAVYKMARAGELKGLQSPEDFLSYFEGMTKAISASGGKVTPNDFAQATKYGKLSSFGLSEDFYTRSLPTMIQSMGATTAGQSLQSLFGTLSGSVSQKSFYKIQDLGLIEDPSKVVQTKTGIQMQPGAVRGYDEFVSNPLAWAKEVLTPLLEKKFGDISDPKNKEAILGELQGMFGNRNSAAAIAELALRSKSFDKDAALIDQARGLGGADALLKSDPTAAMNNFTAAWGNLLAALGGPAVKPATEMMTGIAAGLNRVGELMQAHPDIARNFEGLAAGLAIGLGALAAIGLAAFAPGGAVVIALTALTGALIGFMAINWEKIAADMKRLNDFGNQIGDAIAGMINSVLDKLRAIPGVGRLIPGGKEEFGPPMPPSMAPSAPAYGEDNYKYGMGFSPMAFSNDNASVVDTLAMGVLKGLQMYAAGGGAAGMGGGGSGFIQASYGGGGGLGSAGNSPLLRGATGGANPYAGGSGAGAFVPPIGDHLTAGMRNNNMGNIGWFGQHMAGLIGPSNARDVDHSIGRFDTQESGIRAAAALALSKFHKGRHTVWDIIAAAGGWTPGALGPGASVNIARAMGIGNHDQINLDDPEQMVRFLHGLAIQEHGPAGRFYSEDRIRGALGRRAPTASAPSKTSPGVPASSGPMTTAMNMPPIHAHIYIGGKKVHHEIVKQLAQSGRFPTSVGGPDMHSHYSNAAGTPVTDAA